jgi:hypothetical protein
MLESLNEFINEYCENFRGLMSETSGELELCQPDRALVRPISRISIESNLEWN